MKNKIRLALLLTVLALGLQAKFLHLAAQPTVDYTFTGVCVNSPTQFTVNTAVTNVNAIAIWNWDFGDGNFSIIQDPAHTYAGTGTYTVILTVTDTAGAIGSVTHFVTIQPLPIANFSYNTPNCQNEPVSFLDLSSTTFGFIRTWIWDFGDGSPTDTVQFPDDPNLTHTFPAFGTYNVTLTIINSDSCTNSVSLPVVVTPSPIANFNFSGKCEDQVVQFTDASFANGAGNIVGWLWNFGDPTSGINNTSNLTDPTHLFASPGTYTVSLIVVNFNNCRDTMTKQVTIYPHPPVDFYFTTACLNELVFFRPDTTVTNIYAIGSWDWDFGDGNGSTAMNTAHAYNAPGTYNVILTVTDTAGCINSVFHTVTVNLLPVAHFDAGLNNCAGASVSFNELSSTSVGYIVRWIWDFGDGTFNTIIHPGNPNVQHTYSLAGTYNVTLTIKSSDSCTNFETQSITIHPNPVANFDYGTACDGQPVSFSDLTQNNGGGSLVLWDWNFGDPSSGVANTSTLQNPNHQFTAPGIYQVRLIVASGNGCSDTALIQVTVNPKPFVDFTTQNNCQNNAVLFQPAGAMNLATIATWSWVFGDGGTSPQQSPNHTYSAAGTYNVTLTVVDTAGCSNSVTRPVTIIPEPISDFTYSQPACKDATIQFNSFATAPVGYIIRWTWDFGDGNTQVVNFLGNPNVTHSYANYGTFNVTLTVKTNDSCTHFITKPVVVSANPLANFSYLTTCEDQPVQFSDLSQSGSGGLQDWTWNFGDPASGSSNISTLQNPSHTFSAPVIYTVTLIVTNSGGCKDTIQKQVNVHALPAVDFSTAPGCVNDSTQFVSSTFVNAGAVPNRVWDFGDGFTASNIDDPYHIYTASGSYNVTLTVTDTAGCINTISHTVSVTPPPDAFFQVSAPNCSDHLVFFNDLSTASSGQFTSWFWDFGDGSDTLINAPANPDITHTYIAAGTFTVRLKVNTSLGCEDEYPTTITVSASPLAAFSAEDFCSLAPVNFTSLSTPNGGTAIIGYLWNFGDPTSGINNTSNLQNPSHIYTTAGTYIVLLEVTNADGCNDTTSTSVIVLPKPPVDFTWINTCLGTETEFTVNTTTTNISAVQTFDWDFGDGTPHSTQQDPTHTYTAPSTYNVVLTITDTAGCENAVSYPILIHPQPSAQFSYTSGCLNTPVNFIDQSFTSSGEPITGWSWNFGEAGATNDTSNLQNPSWTYTALGVYNVTLVVTSLSQCTDSVTMAVQVFGLPEAGFTYTAAPCNNGAVYFQDSSFSQQATITGWHWIFEPGQFSTLPNPVHVFYAADSCYDVKLIVTDNRGCNDTVIKNVCVPAPLTATFNFTPTCLRDSTYFTPVLLTPVGDSLVFFDWNFGEPSSGLENTSTLRNPSHYYSQPGTYTVIMQATDTSNCTVMKNQFVVVHPLPVPQFTSTNGLCDSTVYFSQSSSGNGSPLSTWIWNYGDGTIDTVNAPANPDLSHLYQNPGFYNVSLTVINGNNCSETITDSVLVRPCIQAEFTAVDTLICQNYPLAFADSSYCGLPITNWHWDFGDGSDTTYSSYLNPVTHAYDSAGTYTVRMTITTDISGSQISDSTSIIVQVNPSPEAEFTVGRNCFGVTAEFTNITTTNGVPLNTYHWVFGEPAAGSSDTSDIKNPAHLYLAPGMYTIELATENILGCRDTATTLLQVQPLPTAAFENSLACAGDRTEFWDRSDSVVAPISTWNWSFTGEDGILGYRDEQNTSYTFTLPGDYTVGLVVMDTNGCYDTINQPLVVNNIPASIFAFNENFNDIQGQLQFVNTSIDGVKYYWDFGNGESSYAENPVVFYTNDGSYNITLVTWNSLECTDTTVMQYKFMVKGLYIPNAFSPNNPHAEVTLFKPVGINLLSYRIEVYDREENLLWYSEDLDDQGRPAEGWNGKFNGRDVQEGVYMWKASAVFKDGTIWSAENIGKMEPLPKTVFGTVTVIK